MSHLDGEISFNDRSIRSYIDKASAGASASIKSYRLSLPERMRFALLYGLRLATYPTSLFRERFGVPLEEIFGEELDHLEQRGMLIHGSGAVALTLPGILELGAIEDYLNEAPHCSKVTREEHRSGPRVLDPGVGENVRLND